MVLSVGIKLCSVEREGFSRLRGAYLTHFPYIPTTLISYWVHQFGVCLEVLVDSD